MKRRLFFAFCTLLAALACSLCVACHRNLASRFTPAGRCYALSLDSTFTSAERDAIDGALSAWRRATPECFLVRSSGADVTVIRIEHAAEICREDEGGRTICNHAGMWRGSRPGRIELAGDQATVQEFKATMAHEIGHMLGLEHDPSPRALMHWQGGELTTDGEIPPEDRAAYRAR